MVGVVAPPRLHMMCNAEVVDRRLCQSLQIVRITDIGAGQPPRDRPAPDTFRPCLSASVFVDVANHYVGAGNSKCSRNRTAHSAATASHDGSSAVERKAASAA